MSKQLSNESSLENFKREAKRWLRALREGDSDAIARIKRIASPTPVNPSLRDVQHALAKEYGFDGWRALTIELERIAALRVAARNDTSANAFIIDAESHQPLPLLQALLLSASKGETTLAGALLDANPGIINQRGNLPGHTGQRTALHFAVNAPNALEMVRLLLSRGADPNIRDEGDNAFPLHFVAEQGNVVVMAELMDHGAELDGEGDYHELGIMGWATVFGRAPEEAARELLARGASHTLPSAVALGDVSAVRDAFASRPTDLERRLDSSNRRRSLLHLAVVKDHPEILRELIKLGANVEAPDVAGLTPLDQAAMDGKREMAQQLIDAGASIELPAAIALERVADVEILLKAAPDSLKPGNKYGQLIVQASERGAASVIELLLDSGADVNATAVEDASIDNSVGYTALHAAAFHGNLPAVKVLLKRGANVRARESRFCNTPAGWANHGKHDTITQRILREDVDMFDAAAFNLASRVREIAAKDPGAVRRKFGEYIACVRTESEPWKDPDKLPIDAALEWGSTDAAAALRELMSGSRTRHEDIVNRFLINACPDWRTIGGRDQANAMHTASRLLQQHPQLASENIYTAVACGELELVREFVRRDPSSASTPGGPRNWPPLLYLACARLTLHETSEHSIEIARLLLNNGADPNVYCPGGKELIGYDEGGIHYTVFTCIVGYGEPKAPAHPYARELAALLLERDAEPYDVQTLYNVFAPHGSRHLLSNDIVWLLELMHLHSVRRGRSADWNDPSWKMLDVGHYGPGAFYLLSAAANANLLPLVEWMLQHGAGPNVRSYDRHLAQHSLMDMAARADNKPLQELLKRYGADESFSVSFSAYESFVAACFENDRTRATALLEHNREWIRSPRALFEASRKDNANAVRMLLEFGVSPDIEENARRGRPLHAAAFDGAVNAARVLLEAGADPDFRESAYGATPLGVALWAKQPGMVDVISEYSRDLPNLVFAGKVERVRAVLKEDRTRAAQVDGGLSLLMRLPNSEDDAVVLTELLLESGADPALRNTSGETAADIADKRAMPRVVELLRRRT